MLKVVGIRIQETEGRIQNKNLNTLPGMKGEEQTFRPLLARPPVCLIPQPCFPLP